MTREERVAEMAILKSDAEALCKTYNEGIQSGNFEAATKIGEDIAKKVNEYTSHAKEIAFDDCKAAADPMLEAVKVLTYGTIGIKDEKKGDDKVPVRSIVEKDKAIDLLRLHKHCGSIGHDGNWAYFAQKMNFLLTVKTIEDVTPKGESLTAAIKKVNDSYEMSNTAREIEMGKTPTSNTNLLRTLQMVITAMLGDEYKATSHHVAYLKKIYNRKSTRQALTLICADHRRFVSYLAEVCHSIVTGAPIGVAYKEAKES